MAPASEEIQHLVENPLFRGLNPADIRSVMEAGRIRKAAAGSFFFQQEDPAEHAYLLARGQVKLGQLTPEGQQVILNVIGPWTVFGLVAITPNARYPASAQAATDCQAFSWDRATLTRLIALYPKIAVNAMGIMATRVNEFQGQIRTLATERVERRLARVLLRLAREVGRKVEEGVLIDLNVSRQDLAEMSGTTLYTVSRTFSQWERQGLIDAGRERVIIRHPHGLVQIAEDIPAGEPGEAEPQG